ncbi:MAG: glycosyltransferase family 4 protein [Desulfobacteraceae bacterium]|nr:glycosyltransferase family 4 protein [Desulfobacteraceae bacterium]
MTNPLPPKKIAVVIPKYGLTGGAERFAANLTEGLAHNPAYDIHVLANQWETQLDVVTFHKVPIISFPRFLSPLSFAWFVANTLKREHYDLIHTHDRIFHADLFTMHGVPHRFWRREIRDKRLGLVDQMTDWIEKKLLSNYNCNFFLPVSNLSKAHYQRYFPQITSRMRTMHPGVDLEKFTLNKPAAVRNEVRARFGITPSDFVILFVGMNFELKGLATLISGLAKAKASSPRPITLLVVGKGDVKRFGKLAERHGVREKIIFAGVQSQKIEHFYAAADVHALLSDFDTFGLTVLEAMASSLPVIISTQVGAKDLVSEGITGYIVNKNDSNAVGEKILLLLNEPKRQAMGLAARQTAEAHAWTKVIQNVSQLYDDILYRNK